MDTHDTTDAGAALLRRFDAVPPGRWGVAVSGGADSVALLRLALHARPTGEWHVIHLDHETRGGASGGDAEFVGELCGRLGVAATIATISEVSREQGQSNRSARFRAARLALFREAVGRHGLAGVLQGHHANDQAETVLLRLLRGGPVLGMRPRSVVNGLTILRPLLAVTSGELRAHLQRIGQPWREDESNRSMAYRRNRVRAWVGDRSGSRLEQEPRTEGTPEVSGFAPPPLTSGVPSVRGSVGQSAALTTALVRLADAGASVAGWVADCAPRLEASPRLRAITDLPAVLAMQSARRWLRDHDVAPVDAGACQRLVEMASDLATPARSDFPGGVIVRRRSGRLFAQKSGKIGPSDP